MRNEVVEKLIVLMTAAFGLVAALAWNEAIKALFIGPCGSEKAGTFCEISRGGPWAYAIIVTIVVVLITIWVTKVGEKVRK